MLREMLQIKKTKPQNFQVLFLRNDATQQVEVHEVGQVDFTEVQDHLEHGESVFITTKRSQKLNAPKRKEAPCRSPKTRTVEAFYLDHL
jgi:hypothetical protein